MPTSGCGTQTIGREIYNASFIMYCTLFSFSITVNTAEFLNLDLFGKARVFIVSLRAAPKCLIQATRTLWGIDCGQRLLSCLHGR